MVTAERGWTTTAARRAGQMTTTRKAGWSTTAARRAGRKTWKSKARIHVSTMQGTPRLRFAVSVSAVLVTLFLNLSLLLSLLLSVPVLVGAGAEVSAGKLVLEEGVAVEPAVLGIFGQLEGLGGVIREDGRGNRRSRLGRSLVVENVGDEISLMHHLRASCSSASARAVLCVLGEPMMEGLDLILTEKRWGWDGGVTPNLEGVSECRTVASRRCGA
ncbi:hypothetical protein MLD38_006178 [Melastoma candidum]|uniref:Uncharacterized protein n=1 Tax=Melastoma candidum TaxID=119954 RepID=A0ACB9RVJ4_9MYRT|nr:hypothetical protein MLD38_006178 [Melastoma candidum]